MTKFDWEFINDINNPEELHKLKGISCLYRIHLRDTTNENGFFHIPRFIEIDIEGILEIGQTNDLNDRIRLFFRAIKEREKINHSEGRTLQYLHVRSTALASLLGNRDKIKDHIIITYRIVDERNRKDEEREEIDKYIFKFGEPPVLNSTIPGKSKYFNE